MTATSLRIDQLLIDLMRGPDEVESETLAALDDDGWEALVALAHQHRCGPYLAHILAKRQKLKLPARLRVLRDRSVHRTMNIARECLAIHAILAEAGIGHLFLKGVPLAFRDYPEPWARPMRDIDVLIEPGKLDEAHRLLVAAGGHMAAYAHAPVEPSPDGKHLAPIHSPHRILPVEVHYRMISPAVALSRHALDFIEQEVWREPESITVGDAQLPVPGAEVMLAHLVIHGILDHELNNGPLFITDIVHLLRANRLDREKWAGLVEELGLHRAVAITASILPMPEQALLAGDAGTATHLPEETARLLMLQPASQRSQIKLQATLSDAAPASRMALLTGKLFPGRTTLQRRWLAEGGPPDRQPRFIGALWLWYIARKARQYLAPRSSREDLAIDGLRDLRSRLSGGSGRD